MAEVNYVTPEFEERQKLEIRIKEGSLRGKYTTFVKEIRASQIRMEVPTVNGLYLPAKSGQPLLVEYRKRAARCQFESRIVDRDDQPEPPLMSVQRPDRVKRIQKRDFVRVPCNIEAQLVVDETLEDPDLPREVTGQILDLSGGGLKFKTDVALPETTRVYFQFTLPGSGNKFDSLFGYILRREWDEVNEAYIFAVEFEGLLEEQRTALIQYAYRRQLELNKQESSS